MKKEQYRDFANVVEMFFMNYLVKEKGCSSNTIRAYSEFFNFVYL